MEMEKSIECVPVEMLERLKSLLDRLWKDKNPSAVHLSAIMDEFDAERKSLAGIVQEYKSDYAARFAFMERQYKDKILTLESELSDFKTRFSEIDKDRSADSKKVMELVETLKRKESELADLKAGAVETEAQLNARYVARMQELYDKISRKEMDMLSKWEEKNKALETNSSAVENEYSSKLRQIKLREKAMEDDFNSRKQELIKTFERVRLEMEAREKELSERERKFYALEKKRPTVTEDI